jgi:hypothetical protein
MKVFSVFVMVMGYALEVKQLVLFLLFVHDKYHKTCEGQRLPAHAKNQKNFD